MIRILLWVPDKMVISEIIFYKVLECHSQIIQGMKIEKACACANKVVHEQGIFATYPQHVTRNNSFDNITIKEELVQASRL